MKRECGHPNCSQVFDASTKGRARKYCSATCRYGMSDSLRRPNRQTLSYGYQQTAFMNSFLLMRPTR